MDSVERHCQKHPGAVPNMFMMIWGGHAGPYLLPRSVHGFLIQRTRDGADPWRQKMRIGQLINQFSQVPEVILNRNLQGPFYFFKGKLKNGTAIAKRMPKIHLVTWKLCGTYQRTNQLRDSGMPDGNANVGNYQSFID